MCMSVFVLKVCAAGFPSVHLTGVIRLMLHSLCKAWCRMGIYKIPFQSLPETCFLANNKSARDHPNFVADAIKNLLNDIEEQSKPPHYVNSLSVAKGKKLRLVLDLRHVHHGHLLKQSFRYEDLRSLPHLFEDFF